MTYDIDTTTPEGARRLTRVAHACEAYGLRVQYSVFECRLSAVKLERLMAALDDIIDSNVDSVNFYRFDGSLRAARLSFGRPKGHGLGDPWIV